MYIVCIYIYDAMQSFSHVLFSIYQNPELIFHDIKKKIFKNGKGGWEGLGNQ